MFKECEVSRGTEIYDEINNKQKITNSINIAYMGKRQLLL